MPVTLPLSGLCTIEDVLERMAEPGLASATTDESENNAFIDRKIVFACGQIENELISRIEKALAPNQTNSYGQDAETILTKLHNKAVLKACAVAYTIFAMLEEGETRLRFKYDNAGEAITRSLDRWKGEKKTEMNMAWPRLRFDFDGSGAVSSLEASFSRSFSSVRIGV